jgi:hypothetical protein
MLYIDCSENGGGVDGVINKSNKQIYGYVDATTGFCSPLCLASTLPSLLTADGVTICFCVRFLCQPYTLKMQKIVIRQEHKADMLIVSSVSEVKSCFGT